MLNDLFGADCNGCQIICAPFPAGRGQPAPDPHRRFAPNSNLGVVSYALQSLGFGV